MGIYAKITKPGCLDPWRDGRIRERIALPSALTSGIPDPGPPSVGDRPPLERPFREDEGEPLPLRTIRFY